MPYIDPEFREAITMGDRSPGNVGELTYLLTDICLSYAYPRGGSFAVYSEIVAALECAKLEFYRRVLSAYENRKMEENGDVY